MSEMQWRFYLPMTTQSTSTTSSLRMAENATGCARGERCRCGPRPSHRVTRRRSERSRGAAQTTKRQAASELGTAWQFWCRLRVFEGAQVPLGRIYHFYHLYLLFQANASPAAAPNAAEVRLKQRN